MTRTFTFTSAAVLAAVLTAGCVQDDDGGVRDVLPDPQALQIKVPGAEAGGAASGVKSQAVLGETAKFYAMTRTTSRDLNAGATFVLMLVKTITEYPVTSIQAGAYVWGPWNEALNPAEYRLLVRRNAANGWDWSLEGRRKADVGAPFQAVVTGSALPGALPNRGSGNFHMDFDLAERLDPVGNDAEGAIDVVYDLESIPASVKIDYAKPVRNSSGIDELLSFKYSYAEHADRSGDFQFTVHGDLEDPGSSWEDAEIRSRWLGTGAGRSDIRVTNGDLGSNVLTGSECWGTSFSRTYWTDSMGWEATEGDASSCAYSNAMLPGQ